MFLALCNCYFTFTLGEKYCYMLVGCNLEVLFMKVSSIILGLSAVTGICTTSYGIFNPILANAESNRHVIYVDQDHGEIEMDSNNNIISSSSDNLVSDSKVSSHTVVNNAYGRWVYYADGFGNGKTGHSNFYSTKGHHFSWVQMGSKGSKYAYAGSGSYSVATQQGSGTFKCGYGLG